MRLSLGLAALFLVGNVISAAAQDNYANARFGFSAAIPTIVSFDKTESDNGDGVAFHSEDGTAELRVWGSNLIEADLASEARADLQFAKQDGWAVSYAGGKYGRKFAVFSGSKGGRIMYERMVSTCNGQATAHYRIEYPTADKLKYDAAIRSLNASLKAGKGSCN